MKLNYRNERNAKFIEARYRKPLNKPDWYNITNTTDDAVDVLVYDYIGWPYNDARDFVAALTGITAKNITIRVNSPGGDVFDANAIFNAIQSHPSKPTTIIESLAASAASYIAVAGHQKQAYKNAMVMIHEPMTGIWGNQFELREVADILQQISENMVDMYADNTNTGKRELKDMLKVETWMKAKTAKEKGFIDTIIAYGTGAKATFDLSVFNNIPKGFDAQSMCDSKLTEREIEKFLRDGGISNKKAKAILAGCREIGGIKDDDSAVVENDGIQACTAELNKIIQTIQG